MFWRSSFFSPLLPKILGLSFSLLLVLETNAQSKALSFDAGVALVQGEVNGAALISDDIGIGFGASYQANMFGLWDFFVNLSYHQFRFDFAVPSPKANMPYYESRASHAALGLGILVKLYNPSKRSSLYRRVTPYLALVGGLGGVNNEILVLQGFDNSGLTFSEGLNLNPYGEMIFGFHIRVSAEWGVQAFGAARSSMTDFYDGIAGTGGAPDILGRVGMGISLNLR